MTVAKLLVEIDIWKLENLLVSVVITKLEVNHIQLSSIIIVDIVQYDHTGTGQVTRFINNILSLKIGQYLKLFKFES